MHRAYQHDFSFEGVGRHVDTETGKIMNADMTEEQFAAGHKLCADMEAQRQALVATHSIRKAGEFTEDVNRP